MDIKQIKSLIAVEKYYLSLHAEIERDADKITACQIEEALLSPKARIIEDYPNDSRGHSCLILGFAKEGFSIHIVCGMEESGSLVIITVYRPDPKEWIDWQIRKEKKT